MNISDVPDVINNLADNMKVNRKTAAIFYLLGFSHAFGNAWITEYDIEQLIKKLGEPNERT